MLPLTIFERSIYLPASASGAYILSSNHQDGIIRCRRLKDNAAQPLISVPPNEQVVFSFHAVRYHLQICNDFSFV